MNASPASEVVALPRWSQLVPAAAAVLLVLSWGQSLGPFLLTLVSAGLIAAVVAAVHHAEVVAHRVGEPFGTLILAVAVTIIEVALIVTLTVSGDPGQNSALARDTVFAAIMITTNGIVGLALLVGSIRHNTQEFRVQASGGALAILTALATLTLVLPTFTTSTPAKTFSGSQLAFAGVVSLVLYGTYVFVQTIRHRDYFLPVDTNGEGEHAPAPPARTALAALGLLLLCLVCVVGLAKTVSPSLEDGVAAIGAPVSVVGVAIALLVLLPETVASVRAALRNRLQTSLNLALGSALASIGLTIPAVGVASIWLPGELTLGLDAKELVLLVLTVAVSTFTLATGRATVLQGAVHLVLFSSFLFLAFQP